MRDQDYREKPCACGIRLMRWWSYCPCCGRHRGPAPIDLDRSGDPAPLSAPACDCAAKNIACIHGRAFEGAKFAARPAASIVTPLHGDAPDGEATITFAPSMEDVLCLAPDEREAFLCGREKLHREGGGHVYSVQTSVLTREQAIKLCARAAYLDQPGADEAWEYRAWWTRAAFWEAADRVLKGRKRLPRIKGLDVDRFRAAVLAEARKHPVLADEPALRAVVEMPR